MEVYLDGNLVNTYISFDNVFKPSYHKEKRDNKILSKVRSINGSLKFSPSEEIWQILHSKLILEDINNRMKGKWFRNKF